MFKRFLLESVVKKNQMENARINASKPIEQGGLGLPENNTPIDRAKAMGFDVSTKWFHGTPVKKNFRVFKHSSGDRELGDGVYFTKSEYVASRHGRIIPCLLKYKNKFDASINNIDLLKNDFVKKHKILGGNLSDTDIEHQNMVFQYAKNHHPSKIYISAGYDSVINKKSQIPDQINILHGNHIRHVDAAFDPLEKDSEDIYS